MLEKHERRDIQRTDFKYEGFSVFDGELLEVRVRDAHSKGVGLFSSRELKPGQKGVLFAIMPDRNEIEQIPVSVRWCSPDKESSYPYRIGVKILGEK